MMIENDPAQLANLVGFVAAYAFGSAICVGLPVASILLRDPAMPLLRWITAGVISGLIAFTAVGLWFFGLSFPLMFLTFIGPMLIVALILTVIYGALTGLCARALLGWLTWR